VVARGRSGILTRNFRKLHRDTRLKAVQLHLCGKFMNATMGSSGTLTREVHVGGTLGSSSALTR
jgi:hypothetical protein